MEREPGASPYGDAKRIIIVGAGIAGLSAGIYARRNGYEATIYESHYLPGGLCTSWKRKGFRTLRYTNTWQGAPGFMMTKELAGEMFMNPQYTLPGLDGFYMIGQWVKGFGAPMAAASGREVIQKICRADRRRFRPG